MKKNYFNLIQIMLTDHQLNTFENMVAGDLNSIFIGDREFLLFMIGHKELPNSIFELFIIRKDERPLTKRQKHICFVYQRALIKGMTFVTSIPSVSDMGNKL